MAWEEIANGGLLDLYSGLREYEDDIPEGARGLLRLNLRLPVSKETARTIEDALKDQGIPDVKVTTASPVLNIYFRKTFFWLPIIVGVILPLLIVLAIVVISWQLFREIGPANTTLFLVLGIGIATIAGIQLVRRTT